MTGLGAGVLQPPLALPLLGTYPQLLKRQNRLGNIIGLYRDIPADAAQGMIYSKSAVHSSTVHNVRVQYIVGQEIPKSRPLF